MRTYRIAIGCDHAGFTTKEKLATYLLGIGHSIKDFGTFSEQSVDYPDQVHPLAEAVAGAEYDLGIVLCGSGNGVNITCNKHKGIRSALCWIPEIATLARMHNDANICAIPARFVSADLAKEIVSSFLNATFEGGRHAARVSKIE